MSVISQNNSRERFQRVLRFIRFRILHIDDSPHRIALGIALGLFIAWIPLIGLHIFLALALAFLLRANKFAALTSIWVSNPLTFFLIYYPNYLFGKGLLKYFCPPNLAQSTNSQYNPSYPFSRFADIFSVDFRNNIFAVLFKQGQSLWLGSVVLGLLVACAGYLTAYLLIKSHRKNLLQKSASANC
jgi:hypothetical protein